MAPQKEEGENAIKLMCEYKGGIAHNIIHVILAIKGICITTVCAAI